MRISIEIYSFPVFRVKINVLALSRLLDFGTTSQVLLETPELCYKGRLSIARRLRMALVNVHEHAPPMTILEDITL